ncbi:chondramide synthase [Pycnococcus provasolii]
MAITTILARSAPSKPVPAESSDALIFVDENGVSQPELAQTCEALNLPKRAWLFALSTGAAEESSLHAPTITLCWNATCHEPGAAARVLAHLEVLLGSVASSAAMGESDAQQPACQLRYMTKEELNTELFTWNSTAAPMDEVGTSTLVSRAATKYPNNVAASCTESDTLTYDALRSRVGTVAARLAAALNIKSDVPRPAGASATFVGIFLPRDVDVACALLAVMTTGCAYVPLDPVYPPDRIQCMLEDARCPAVLTRRKYVDKLPASDDVKVVLLDDDSSSSSSSNEVFPMESPVACKPADTAYCLFTSGSTGRPKGVPITHLSLTNLLRSFERALLDELRPDGGCLVAVTTICFDISGLEMYLPLMNGCRLHVATYDEARDPALLGELLQSVNATCMQATPATWRALLQFGGDVAVNAMAKIAALCGGEALPFELAVSLRRSVNRLLNVYGPTETTIWSTFAEIPTNVAETGIPGCIGTPIANTTVYVLDKFGQPCPVGVPGELVIGGIGLSAGYLHRPDLSQGRFLHDPYNGVPDLSEGSLPAGFPPARLYRTGDVARWTSDGQLVCMGRLDHQVKIRGFRIELGECEAALAECDGVFAGVVAACKPSEEQANELVAYVIPESRASDDVLNKLEEEDDDDDDEEEDDDNDEGGADLDEVNIWGDVYDEAYATQNAVQEDPTLNYSGYDNSFTPNVVHEPPPIAEWADYTGVNCIRLRPNRCMELGAGNGMIFLRVASGVAVGGYYMSRPNESVKPACELYIASDLANVALKYVAETIAGKTEATAPFQPLESVTKFRRCGAHESFKFASKENLDVIICNGVSMYFPSARYLLRVVRQGVKTVTPGGRFFLGDVRNLLLFPHFHHSIALYVTASEEERGQAVGPVNRLAAQARRRGAREKELLVDPAIFIDAFPSRTYDPSACDAHDVARVEMTIKRGYYRTEFGLYRYDVTFYKRGDDKDGVGKAADVAGLPVNFEDFDAKRHSLAALYARLSASDAPDHVAIAEIPDARLVQEHDTVMRLQALEDGTETFEGDVRALKADVERMHDVHGAEMCALQPEDIMDVAVACGYDCQICPSLCGDPSKAGHVDVLMVKDPAVAEFAEKRRAELRASGEASEAAPWAKVAHMAAPCSWPPARFKYVSCAEASLRRDPRRSGGGSTGTTPAGQALDEATFSALASDALFQPRGTVAPIRHKGQWKKYTNKYEQERARRAAMRDEDRERMLAAGGHADGLPEDAPRPLPKVAQRGVKDAMRKRLPDYMVPTKYVSMSEFPMTSNGKVDRKALPNPYEVYDSVGAALDDEDDGDDARDGEPPATDTERTLADFWKPMLHADHVFRQDSFFKLGGHSLLAMQLVNKVKQVYKVKQIKLSDLIENDTLQKLGAFVDMHREDGGVAASPAAEEEIAMDLPTVVELQKQPFGVSLRPRVYIPVSDGAKLASRVWLPCLQGAEEFARGQSFPTVVEVNPYRTSDGTVDLDASTYPWLAAHGVACVRVDVRGTGDSTGLLEDEYTERQVLDALDVVAWCAEQPWCSGSVGLMGVSWSGFVAMQAASHPSSRGSALKAVAAMAATHRRDRDDMHVRNGCVLGVQHTWQTWLAHILYQPPTELPDGTGAGSVAELEKAWLARCEAATPPEAKLLAALKDARTGVETTSAARGAWAQGSCDAEASLNVPAFLSGGLEAGGYADSLASLSAALEKRGVPHNVSLGPWAHQFPHISPVGPLAGYLQELLHFWRTHLGGAKCSDASNESKISEIDEMCAKAAVEPPRARVFLATAKTADQHVACGEGGMGTCTPGRWAVLANGGIGDGSWVAKHSNASSVPRVLAFGDGGVLAADASIGGAGVVIGKTSPGVASGSWASFGRCGDAPGDQASDDDMCACFDASPDETGSSGTMVVGVPVVSVRVSDSAKGYVVARLCAVRADGTSTRVAWGVADVAGGGDVEIPMSLTSFELTSGCHWRVALSRSYWPFVVASTSNDELPISAGRLTLPGCVESSHFPSDAAIYGESAVPPPSLIAPAVPSTTVGDAAAAEARRTVSVDGSLWNLVEDRGTRVYEATATHPVLSGDRTSSHWSSWSCTEEATRKDDGSDSHTATYKSSHARLGGAGTPPGCMTTELTSTLVSQPSAFKLTTHVKCIGIEGHVVFEKQFSEELSRKH